MRNCRALLLAIAALIVLIIALLFALLNRHSTITTVVSSGGLVGGSAKTGDTLTFRTYQKGDPGYTVEFTGVSPCANNIQKLPVTSDQPGSCPIAASEDTQVSYFYTIHRNIGQQGVHPNTVVPCKLCYLGLGSSPDGDAEQVKHATIPPGDNANVQVGCTIGKDGVPGVSPDPAKVTNDGVATVGWLQVDSPWTVTFKDSNPCLTTNTFSNDGTAQCSVDPKAAPNSYSYYWTLTCNGKPANGYGTVTLYPPSQPQQ
jgi:hypothetical protein